MIRRSLLGALAVLALGRLAAPAFADLPPASAVAGRDYAAGHVLVRYASEASTSGYHVVRVRPGRTVTETVAALERRPGVASASPDWIAHASFVPNDPGTLGVPGGWQQLQWNLASPAGIGAPQAWDHLIAAGRAGGRGVVVAVLDTGVAYKDLGRFRRSPDLSAKRFRRGYDFVDKDPYAVDDNGHGTHVASTIAEVANNHIGVPGIAYGATIMPVRVLNRYGAGHTSWIAAGIRYAAAHGAQVINMSFEFSPGLTSADLPDVMAALRYARRKGVVIVAAAGNEGLPAVAYPARARSVIGVGATTADRCLAKYSNDGPELDLVAPGGGPDSADVGCAASAAGAARDIYQMTFTTSVRSFGLPGGYDGTSMATPHVAATAALVIASGVLGRHPTPGAVTARLERTATDLGPPGHDRDYGFGLINAAGATDPAVP